MKAAYWTGEVGVQAAESLGLVLEVALPFPDRALQSLVDAVEVLAVEAAAEEELGQSEAREVLQRQEGAAR